MVLPLNSTNAAKTNKLTAENAQVTESYWQAHTSRWKAS